MPYCARGLDRIQPIPDKYKVFTLIGGGKSEGDAATVRANHSISPSCGIFYFEVHIISKGRDGYDCMCVVGAHYCTVTLELAFVQRLCLLLGCQVFIIVRIGQL